jgi:phospho-N-acetylmuramoyl-pentapeptide-transferase
MLYNILDYFRDSIDFPGVGLFRYISFRSISAVTLSLLIALFAGKIIIRKLAKRQIGEDIRELGLEGQLQKKGTPTMGGIIILISTLIPVLLLADLSNVYVWLLVITAVILGFIGFIDDYIKVFKKNKDGLNGKFKIAGQVILGVIVGVTLYCSDQAVVRLPVGATEAETCSEIIASENSGTEQVTYLKDVKSTVTTIPFVKDNEFDYAWLTPLKGKAGEVAGWIIYILAIVFIITAVSNGSNLTDGMDGLATGVSAIVGVAIGILAYLSGNIIYADYLNILYLPNTGETVVVMAAFIGALIGFLWYNSYPAQVFMGDTGSLAVGGIIAVAAIIIRKELLIPILCGIFFVESLSVIIQRGYFKYTKKRRGEGARVFKMSPLHHHFQKEGVEALIKSPERAIPEAKIVMRFWIMTLLLVIIAIITLKIR